MSQINKINTSSSSQHFLFDDAFDRDEKGQPKKKYLRRLIDPHSSILRFKLHRIMNQLKRPPYLYQHLSYAKDMTPGFFGEQSTIPSKYIHTAINKNRCPINCVEWQPNGRRVLTASHTGEFTQWNGITFNFENLTQGHTSSVRALAWSPDGEFLLSGDTTGTLKIWNSLYENLTQINAHTEMIRDIAMSPTGVKLGTCADDATAKIWDLHTQTCDTLLEGHGWDVRSVDWHPNMALLATGSKDFNIKLWDPRKNSAICTIHAHKGVVSRLRWSPDGQWLVSGGRDQVIKLMDVRKMDTEMSFRGHTREITCLSWNPNTRGVFSSGSYDGQICHWSVYHEEEPVVPIIGAHDGSIWAMSYHPLGHLMVSGSHDNCTKFWARPRPGDPDPSTQVPKGRMYHETFNRIQQRANLLTG